jgi:hypothetical protein
VRGSLQRRNDQVRVTKILKHQTKRRVDAGSRLNLGPWKMSLKRYGFLYVRPKRRRRMSVDGFERDQLSFLQNIHTHTHIYTDDGCILADYILHTHIAGSISMIHLNSCLV